MGTGTAESTALITLQTQLNTQIAAAKAITAEWAGKEDQMPAEVDTKLQGILGSADTLKARITNLQRLANHEDDLDQPTEAPLAWRQATPKEGVPDVDEKAWREFEIPTLLGTKKFRFNVPKAAEAKNYKHAFEAYLRYGDKKAAANYPNDFKVLVSGSDSAGGFLITPDMQADLLRKIATLAMIRSLARVISTSSNLVQWATVKYTTDNKYTSPVRMTWTGEQPASGSVHRVTDQVYGEKNIPIHTAMASQPISRNLIEDAGFDVIGDSSNFLSEAFALGENDAFLNGNGVSRPLGIITQVSSVADDSTYIPYVASGTSAAISTSGDAHSGKRLIDLYYALPSQYRARAVWLMNSNTMALVDNLVDAQKRPIVRELTVASIGMGEPSVIKGRRVAADEFMPDASADLMPILFADFSGYLVADRVGFSIERYNEIYANENQVLLLARKRVGGSPIEGYRMRALKAGTS